MKSSLTISAAASLAASLLPAASVAFVAPTPSSTQSTTTISSSIVVSSSTSTSSSLLSAAPQIQEDLTFTPPDTLNDGEISEQLCTDAASKMKRVMVPVSKDVSDTGYVGISFIHWQAAENNKNKNTLPLLLVHGFDSSALEYRRLGPKLAELGVDVYCVDLLGWGYTQLEDVNSFGAKAKVEALKGFWQTVGGNGEVIVGGASLGGAAVIEFASENLYKMTAASSEGDANDSDATSTEGEVEGFVRGAVLIDAQGFVDGIGPMSFLPAPLARAGIKVLQSVPLRSSANTMSYYDADTYATDDALKVGRMHCMRDGWEDGMLSFMQSGGFQPKNKVPQIDVPTLVLWGRQDGILEGKEFANKFVESMPDARLQWVEECGHVPHLEQPEVTAGYIEEFLRLEEVRPLNTKSGNAGAGNIFDGLFSFLN